MFHIYSRFILENYSGTILEHICQNMNIEQFLNCLDIFRRIPELSKFLEHKFAVVTLTRIQTVFHSAHITYIITGILQVKLIKIGDECSVNKLSSMKRNLTFSHYS